MLGRNRPAPSCPAGQLWTNPNRICRCKDEVLRDSSGRFTNNVLVARIRSRMYSRCPSVHPLCGCGSSRPVDFDSPARSRDSNSAVPSAYKSTAGIPCPPYSPPVGGRTPLGDWLRPRRGGGSGPRAAGPRLLLSSDLANPNPS